MPVSYPHTFGPLTGQIPTTYLDDNFTAINSHIGTAAGNLVELDGSAKLPAVDGSQLTNLPSSSRTPVRQTILSGPLDANGLPNFGGATGGTTVTMTGTLIGSAANGFTSSGQSDSIGTGTNLSWGTGTPAINAALSTNGVMYLGVTMLNGAMTAFTTTLAPVYEFGGTPAITAKQFTFNIQAMQNYLGNGASADATQNAIIVGEVLVAANVVSTITWYALMGRYDSGLFSVGTGTTYSKNHNLGLLYYNIDLSLADDASGTNERFMQNGIATVGSFYYGGACTTNATAVVTLGTNIGTSTAGAGIATGYYRMRARRSF